MSWSEFGEVRPWYERLNPWQWDDRPPVEQLSRWSIRQPFARALGFYPKGWTREWEDEALRRHLNRADEEELRMYLHPAHYLYHAFLSPEDWGLDQDAEPAPIPWDWPWSEWDVWEEWAIWDSWHGI